VNTKRVNHQWSVEVNYAIENEGLIANEKKFGGGKALGRVGGGHHTSTWEKPHGKEQTARTRELLANSIGIT